MTRALLVALGSPDRGDDAVGAAVVREVAARLDRLDHLDRTGLVEAVDVVEREDPTALLDLWAGRELTVVVDAVRSGATPGTVHRVETGPDAAPLPATAGHGTHTLGLPDAVALARALGRLPDRLVVVGVEAGGFTHGARLSPPVAAAVGAAAAVVLDALDAPAGPAGPAGPATGTGVSRGVPR